MKQKCFISFVQ